MHYLATVTKSNRHDDATSGVRPFDTAPEYVEETESASLAWGRLFTHRESELDDVGFWEENEDRIDDGLEALEERNDENQVGVMHAPDPHDRRRSVRYEVRWNPEIRIREEPSNIEALTTWLNAEERMSRGFTDAEVKALAGQYPIRPHLQRLAEGRHVGYGALMAEIRDLAGRGSGYQRTVAGGLLDWLNDRTGLGEQDYAPPPP